MSELMASVPHSPIEEVTDILHGVAVTDPYRWLEDQESTRTRAWIAAQTQFARSYLDGAPGRDGIRDRIQELIDVETYDSIQKIGLRYFFRKRIRGQEQPSIFFRDGIEGEDQLLVDPAKRGTGKHTAVKPLRVSPNGRLLLYQVKEGGERSGRFEFVDVETRRALPDRLPRGYLRGFAFAEDSDSFYYVHEAADANRPYFRAAYHHILGTSSKNDTEVFVAGESSKLHLSIIPGTHTLGFVVSRFLDQRYTDFYLWPMGGTGRPRLLIGKAEYRFEPVFDSRDRILAITDLSAANCRIVEVRERNHEKPKFLDLVPPSDSPIQDWTVTAQHIVLLYLRNLKPAIELFDLFGRRVTNLPVDDSSTIRLVGGATDRSELVFERESFSKPVQIYTYSPADSVVKPWAGSTAIAEFKSLEHIQVWFDGKDKTRVPMFLVGKPDVLNGGPHPAIMTAYGGYGRAMTPQFSVFVAFLLERGCLFAVPNIRGGSEFGLEWHNAARGRNKQVAFDDFISAAEWLVQTGRTEPKRLGIFGGSNAGLLVGAALTQRPDLFRAAVCMVPILDMLRYHLFDSADVWKDEFGIADDVEDFIALASYSPYHQVRGGTSYPATLIVSGDSDQNCSPIHARKMTARLQAASTSGLPILLDYSTTRGHSPVLPLSQRVEALTDRMAFLCDQLGLSTGQDGGSSCQSSP